jgi:hypothetical protein
MSKKIARQLQQWVDMQDYFQLTRFNALIQQGNTPARAIRVMRIADREWNAKQQGT